MADEPWSVRVRLAELGRGPVKQALVADERARARIAERLDLVSLDRLAADVRVRPWMDGAEVSGRWSATVVQICGLTLDPFPSDLRGEFEVRCVPADSPLAPAPGSEVVVDPDAEDPPDVLETDSVDIAAYVVEHLALDIDPFPRRPGVVFEAPDAEPEPSPFAVLSRLRPAGASED